MSGSVHERPQPNIETLVQNAQAPRKRTWGELFTVLGLKVGHIGRLIIGLGKDTSYTNKILNSYANGSLRFHDLATNFGSYSVSATKIVQQVCTEGKPCGLSPEAITRIKENFQNGRPILTTLNALLSLKKDPDNVKVTLKDLYLEAEKHKQDKAQWRDSIKSILPPDKNVEEFFRNVEELSKPSSNKQVESAFREIFPEYPLYTQLAIYTNPDISHERAEQLRNRMFFGWAEKEREYLGEPMMARPQHRFGYLEKLGTLANRFQNKELRDRIDEFERKFVAYISSYLGAPKLDFHIEQYLHLPSEKFDEPEIEYLVRSCAVEDKLHAAIQHAEMLMRYDNTTADNCSRFIDAAKQKLQEQVATWNRFEHNKPSMENLDSLQLTDLLPLYFRPDLTLQDLRQIERRIISSYKDTPEATNTFLKTWEGTLARLSGGEARLEMLRQKLEFVDQVKESYNVEEGMKAWGKYVMEREISIPAKVDIQELMQQKKFAALFAYFVKPDLIYDNEVLDVAQQIRESYAKASPEVRKEIRQFLLESPNLTKIPLADTRIGGLEEIFESIDEYIKMYQDGDADTKKEIHRQLSATPILKYILEAQEFRS